MPPPAASGTKLNARPLARSETLGLIIMAFDGALFDTGRVQAAVAARSDEFRRGERFVVLGGASALGALMGFASAMALGNADLMVMIAVAAPALAFALYLTSEMLRDGLRRGAYGCAASAGVHAAALLAWPMTALLSPMSATIFWIAPAMALTALSMLASCWQGSKAGVYRVGVMGMMIAGLAAQQATAMTLGG
jgi:hypothetical protein